VSSEDEQLEITAEEAFLELVGEVAFLIDSMETEERSAILLATQFRASVLATIQFNRSNTIH
jgi:hypothetical protein